MVVVVVVTAQWITHVSPRTTIVRRMFPSSDNRMIHAAIVGEIAIFHFLSLLLLVLPSGFVSFAPPAPPLLVPFPSLPVEQFPCRFDPSFHLHHRERFYSLIPCFPASPVLLLLPHAAVVVVVVLSRTNELSFVSAAAHHRAAARLQMHVIGRRRSVISIGLFAPAFYWRSRLP